MRLHHGTTTPFIVLPATTSLGSQHLTALGCIDAVHNGCIDSILVLSIQGPILKLTVFQNKICWILGQLLTEKAIFFQDVYQ
jgi:hypothetical protein